MHDQYEYANLFRAHCTLRSVGVYLRSDFRDRVVCGIACWRRTAVSSLDKHQNRRSDVKVATSARGTEPGNPSGSTSSSPESCQMSTNTKARPAGRLPARRAGRLRRQMNPTTTMTVPAAAAIRTTAVALLAPHGAGRPLSRAEARAAALPPLPVRTLVRPLQTIAFGSGLPRRLSG